jgi:molecular chaperone HtpG
MTESSEKIPFSIEIGRVIEVLAAQIYPSPFALLRENVQNSYDAILQRKHLGQSFDPKIELTIEQNRIQVLDNGIGMSRQDLRNHYWRAGSSSKNTPEAKLAVVVGTVGIGAMANFGIAEELHVISESALANERTKCVARRSTLSVTEDCIEFNTEQPSGSAGTTVTAILQAGHTINVDQARSFIVQFVSFLPIKVLVNGTLVSGQRIDEAVPALVPTWEVRGSAKDLGGGLVADIVLTGAVSGDVRIDLAQIQYGGQKLNGRLIIRQGGGSLRTFRSSFGLATTNVSSIYGFGGLADFLFLEPTAGREALTTGSMQLLQQIITQVDEFVSLELGQRPESNANGNFVNWASQRQRYDLCSHLRVRVEPGDTRPLHELQQVSQASPLLVYSGTDAATIQHASEDRRIVMLSRDQHRNRCELGYLRKYCRIEELADQPKVLQENAPSQYTLAESALAFRFASILSGDYFLDCTVKFGRISHGFPVLVTQRATPVEIFIDPAGPSISLILSLYETEYGAFGHMAKDFVRNFIFQRVADLVPSATKQGAEAFLKIVQRNREIFEYERADLESLTSLWKEYLSGKIDMLEATKRSEAVATRSYQYIDSGAAGAVRDVVPDVVQNNANPDQAQGIGPLPPIQRLDIPTERKLLTIAENEPALKGFRCFLAISDRVREERGEFFLQPHTTSVVWGGQRALFIFEHHSGEFGLYYDIQTQSPLSEQSGGGAFETSTIVMKNRIFIPVPPSIQRNFVPESGERKRLEVRCDILHIDRLGAQKAA